MPGRAFTRLVVATFGLLAFGCGAAARAQDSLEAAVKAAFLVKFAAFVGWPAATVDRRPLALCVQGDDAVAGEIDRAAAGPALLRPIVVRKLAAVDSSSDCDILYAAGSPRQTTDQALDAVRGLPVLTVTDSAPATHRGMIDFVVFDNRVRFHIDAGAASRAGLTISSKLLALGLSVKR